jgi:uncharacterized membrane protein YhaH (DUF805 family)
MNLVHLFFSTRGRVGRATYWTVIGIWLLIDLLLRGTLSAVSHWSGNELLVALFFWAWVGFSVLSFFPMLAMQVKRLHDTGRSGWWMLFQFGFLLSLMFMVTELARQHLGSLMGWVLLLLACSLGLLLVFVFTLFPGDDGSNDYGLAG